MLDPGRYFAEAIYFLQYALAQILWALDRALLSIAVVAESVNLWVTENIGYFVQLLVNALSAPLGGMLILALTALGAWYAFNNIVPTGRWVDPARLLLYGFIALFFFSAPVLIIDGMEALRAGLNAGIDQSLIDGAAGNIFAASMNGTDPGLPSGVPDVNSDGFLGSFDLVAALMGVANIDELDSSEFPVNFEAAFFPFGDPAGIDLSDEADQELAKALASDGIERLFFALVAIPTAVAEHFLRLALTGVAVLLYLGVPIAMLFAFFVYTQAYLATYLRQFVNLLIETLISVILVAVMVTLLAAAAQQGIGLFIAASLMALVVLVWRIISALKLASSALNLFGGGALTGGATGMDAANLAKGAATGAVGLAGAALTGGATLALGGAALASAAAIGADGRASGNYLGTDPEKAAGRARQLKSVAGYTLGQSDGARSLIEGAHEVRTLARNFRDGEAQPHSPDLLDYLRTGSSMSGFGSSPWLAMRLSPSLRAAYDEIGGARPGGHFLDEGGAPVTGTAVTPGRQQGSVAHGPSSPPGPPPGDLAVPSSPAAGATRSPDEGALPPHYARLEQALNDLTQALTTRLPDAEPVEAESVNGPVPDWLRDEATPSSAVQDVNVVRVAPDLDRDGLDDRQEGMGAVRFQPHDADRATRLDEALADLAEPESSAGQASHRLLVAYAGAENADRLQQAVSEHGSDAVRAAADAMAGQVETYRAQALTEAAILDRFRGGEAAAAIRQTLDTPLGDEQLATVADVVLLPRRELSRAELVAAIGRQVTAGQATEAAIAGAIGLPASADFGPYTGAVRGVVAAAEEMALSAAELTRLAALIGQGQRGAVAAALHAAGHRPAQIGTFISDVAALPPALTVPQTTAVAAREGEGE